MADMIPGWENVALLNKARMERNEAREDRDILQQRLAKEQRGRNHVCRSLSSVELKANQLEMDLAEARTQRDEARAGRDLAKRIAKRTQADCEEARAIACKMLTERNEARAERNEAQSRAEQLDDIAGRALAIAADGYDAYEADEVEERGHD